MALKTVAENPNADTLEDASGSLCVANTLLLAVDNFVDEIRKWSKPGSIRADRHVFQQSLHAQTLLGELQDKIAAAKATIDSSVDGGFARGAE